ncbi:MAG TPA: hypothetical protein VFR28_04970 [Allosphingosinicella sp.]|nr:hypothetical protein [Allosphingosinicella sp.]
MADKLRVLVINDLGEPKAPFDALLEIDLAREPEDAQAFMLKSIRNGQSYDIIACDVNFADSDTVKNLVHSNGADPALVPLGPILALPFLSSASTIFVPYSSFWDKLRRHPDIGLLSALGMIRARERDEVEPIDQIAEALQGGNEAVRRQESLAGTLSTALGQGLRLYRKRLFSDSLRLGNLGLLADRLEALKVDGRWPPDDFQEALADVQNQVVRPPDALPVHMLLRDEQGVLGITVTRIRRSRTIGLASLYADYFLSTLNPDDITGMAPPQEVWANAYLAITNDLGSAEGVPGGASGDFAKEVASTLRLTDQNDSSWSAGNTLTAVLRQRKKLREQRFPGVEEGVFVRACVLAAWVQAWQLHQSGFIQRTQLRPVVKRILGIAPANKEDRNDGTTHYRRFFMNDNGEPKRDADGEVTWARPFRNDRSNIERWQLDTDEPANLPSFDRTFCEVYASLPEAEGGLDWTIGADGDQAPSWMTTEM